MVIAEKIIKIAVALFLIFACLTLSCCQLTEQEETLPGAEGEEKPLAVKLVIKEEQFDLELALNGEQRERGLMGREEIAENGGMLFVMPAKEPFPTELFFWMKGCLVPIDVIFLSPAGVVTAVHAMQPPEEGVTDEELVRYGSEEKAQFAIELRGGRAGGLGIKKGDQLELPLEWLLDLAE